LVPGTKTGKLLLTHSKTPEAIADEQRLPAFFFIQSNVWFAIIGLLRKDWEGLFMKTGLDLINDIDNCVLGKEEMAFWWLGQMGYAVKMGDAVVYLDLFLSELAGRNIPPLLQPQEITNADFIIGSHDHIDHIDRDVWHQLSLSSPDAVFVVPALLVKSLARELDIPEARFAGLDDGKSFMKQGLKITGIPAAHEFLDQDTTTGQYPYLGCIVEGNGRTLYHAGDSCIYEGLQQRLRKWAKIDVMFLPINGRDARRYLDNCIGNMTYQEAVDLAGSIRPGLVVPGHYEMFTGNSADPMLFAAYLEAKYPGVAYWIGSHGERVLVK
jgi:L-ascorbate 6-phosphate lactonase